MEPIESEIAARIWGSARLWDDFAALCATGGRFAGTESEDRATELLRARLDEIAPGKVVEHRFDYDGWRRVSGALTLATGERLPAHPLVWSPPASLDLEVVDLGRGTEEQFRARAAEIRGRAVLVRHEYMFAAGHIHRRRKYLWAKEAGAAAFLIAGPLPGQALVTGSSGTGGPDDIPAAGIALETAARIGGSIRLELVTEKRKSVARNLLLDLPGRTEEWVVLSAHIDGHDLAQSALDNGSGLAVALEVARHVAPHAAKLRRGLRVAFFTIEEWALAGSKRYVDELPEGERDRIALDVNLDSVAGSARLTACTSGFSELGPYLSGIAARRGLALGIHEPLMANSDHASFAAHGIPAFRLVAGFDEPASNLRYVLTPADTIDKAAPSELKLAALLTASIVLDACGGDWRAARNRVR
jgi:Iap family predicted aminopeptidase